MSVFEGLHPDIRRGLEILGIDRPTTPQDVAIPAILREEGILLVAPTASGKTEAAFLPVFHRFLEEGRKKGISIIYITPLRALNRDIFKRLVFWGEQLGIDIQVRHGDTSRRQRRSQSLNPPDILITTPETLQAILPSKSMRKHLRSVRWVIIDEIHDLASSKRGAQLAVGLERLDELTGKPVNRLGLSATVGNPSRISDFLGGEQRVRVLEVEVDKSYNFSVIFPAPTERDYDTSYDLNTSPTTAARLNHILSLIDRHNSTLVFVQGRGQAESLGHKIGRLSDGIEVHHGSLSREQRHRVEDSFKEGNLKAIICTSTLQLGIDVGEVDLTIQYLSPRQVTTLVQRVGRAGHTLERRSSGVTIPAYGEDILESLVASKRARSMKLEPTVLHSNPLDVLCHQIVGIALAADCGVKPGYIYNLIRRTYPFRDYPRSDFNEMIQFLLDIALLQREGDKLMSNGRGRLYYYENLGMIADERRYPFINVVTDEMIGTVGDEFWSLRARLGLNVILRGRVWRIIRIDEEGSRLYVIPSEDPLGALPGWDGEIISVPREVTEDVGDLREHIAELLDSVDRTKAILELAEELGTDTNTIDESAKEVEEHLSRGFPLPTKDLILLEAYDKFLVIHSCYGERVNSTIGAILDVVFSERDMIYNWWNDQYRILVEANFKINEWDLRDFEDVLKDLTPQSVEERVKEYMETRFPFLYRMKYIAERFGVIPRGKTMGPKRLDRLYLQYKNTPIYEETLREVYHEKMDVETVKQIFSRINSGDLKVVSRLSEEPSPLSAHILERYSDVEELIAGGVLAGSQIEDMRRSIRSKKANLLCLGCGTWSEHIRIRELNEAPTCPNCGSRRISMLRRGQDPEYVSQLFERWSGGEDLLMGEREILTKARKTADMVLSYGRRAIEALSVYGIGPVTSYQVLSKMHRDDEEFYVDLLEAKIRYIKTRRFWED
ncbi:MAG: DEAD/DEAH box helicase [Candidatus Bathyarchaeia archaeon]